MKSRFVLLIDDDPDVLILMRDAFLEAEFHVETALDGAAGLRAFEAEPPDLVITDIIMPTREGIETIVEMRRRSPGVRIIAVSGGGRIGGLDFLELAKHLGADATRAKPFRMAELVSLGESLLAASVADAA